MTFPSVTPALPPCPKRTDVNNAGGSVLDDHNPPKWVTFACRFTTLTVYQAQDKQLGIQKKKGALVDRARAEALVFRLARQERDTWVTWPNRVAALMAAEVALGVEKQTGTPVIIEAAILQRVLEAHVRQHLDALADLRVSLG